ncbi:hypothetical protein [Thioalkalivibrio sp. ALJ8]|uniref:hypothetical protein n=1 Tax=Thioalkalivibrio sp. ALJ8 TaxID=1158757 RepID=UPI00037B9FE5|nr:hypothetical protein [Thioalkalivibrio sp. ALJ8]
MISLTHDGTTLTLPGDLFWADRYGWRSVTAAAQYTLTGALVLEYHQRQAGRPITLEAARDRAWMDRGTADTLQAWANIPGAEMQLDWHGEIHTVHWRHEDGALELETLRELVPHQSADRVIATLRFLETPE